MWGKEDPNLGDRVACADAADVVYDGTEPFFALKIGAFSCFCVHRPAVLTDDVEAAQIKREYPGVPCSDSVDVGDEHVEYDEFIAAQAKSKERQTAPSTSSQGIGQRLSPGSGFSVRHSGDATGSESRGRPTVGAPPSSKQEFQAGEHDAVGGRQGHTLSSPSRMPAADSDKLWRKRGSLSESVDWLNCVMAKVWSHAAPAVRKKLEAEIIPKLLEKLPAAVKSMLGTDAGEILRLGSFSLGEQPPTIGDVTIHFTPSACGVELRSRIVYETKSIDMELLTAVGKLGINNFKLDGTLVMRIEPFVDQIPIVGGVTAFFLEPPHVEVQFSGLASVANSLSDVVNDAVETAMRDNMVLPHVVGAQTALKQDLALIQGPSPVGVLRVTAVRARGLPGSDFNPFGERTSDPYVKVRLADDVWRCVTIQENLNPVWDVSAPANSHDFLVYDLSQRVVIEVYDEDTFKADDVLGRVQRLTVVDVLQRVVAEESHDLGFKLYDIEDNKTAHGSECGTLCLRFQWLRLVDYEEGHDGMVLTTKVKSVFLPSAVGDHVGLSVSVGDMQRKSSIKKWKDPAEIDQQLRNKLDRMLKNFHAHERGVDIDLEWDKERSGAAKSVPEVKQVHVETVLHMAMARLKDENRHVRLSLISSKLSFGTPIGEHTVSIAQVPDRGPFGFPWPAVRDSSSIIKNRSKSAGFNTPRSSARSLRRHLSGFVRRPTQEFAEGQGDSDRSPRPERRQLAALAIPEAAPPEEPLRFASAQGGPPIEAEVLLSKRGLQIIPRAKEPEAVDSICDCGGEFAAWEEKGLRHCQSCGLRMPDLSIQALLETWRLTDEYVERAMQATREEFASGAIEENAETTTWLNIIFRRAWPMAVRAVEQKIQDEVLVTLNDKLPHALQGIQLESFYLPDDKPPCLGSVTVHRTGRDHRGESSAGVELRARVSYSSEVEISFSTPMGSLGLTAVSFSADMSLRIEPMVDEIPVIGGVSMFCLTPPEFDFEFSGLPFDKFPGVHTIFHDVLQDVVNQHLVMPNVVSNTLSPLVDPVEISKPHPIGVLRVRPISATGLQGKDWHMFSKPTSDPYVQIKVGNHAWKSSTVPKTCDPKWKESDVRLFPVYSFDQRVLISIFDEDMLKSDYLGSVAPVRIEEVVSMSRRPIKLQDLTGGRGTRAEDGQAKRKGADRASSTQTAGSKGSDGASSKKTTRGDSQDMGSITVSFDWLQLQTTNAQRGDGWLITVHVSEVYMPEHFGEHVAITARVGALERSTPAKRRKDPHEYEIMLQRKLKKLIGKGEESGIKYKLMAKLQEEDPSAHRHEVEMSLHLPIPHADFDEPLELGVVDKKANKLGTRSFKLQEVLLSPSHTFPVGDDPTLEFESSKGERIFVHAKLSICGLHVGELR